jgi:hypothetical protein
VVGLVILIAVCLSLNAQVYRPHYPRWYALGLGLVLAAFAWNERDRFRGWGRMVHSRWRRLLPELGAVVAMQAVFVYLGTFDLDNWRYASIGDEGAFYFLAKAFALDEGDPRNLFSQRGVYDAFPLLATYFVGQLMRVFGTDGVGWKTATLVPVVLALALGYLLARTLYGRRPALLFLGLAVTAHYLLAFTHTGYNNLDPLLPAVGALLFFNLGLRHASPLLLVLSGVAAGLGWYTYYSSRTMIVLLAVAIGLMVRPRRWIPTGTVVAAGFLAVVVPLFAVDRGEVLGKMIEHSGVGNRAEAGENANSLLYWNVGRSLLAFNYNTHHSHYTSGSLVEPVTAVLFVLGLGYCLLTLADARSRLLLAWFGLGITTTGILSRYNHVSVTRLHYILPVVLLLAALAVDRTLAAWRPAKSTWIARAVMAAIVAGVIGLAGVSNLHRWLVVSPRETPTSPNTVTVRIVRDQRCQDARLTPLLLDMNGDGALAVALEQVGGLSPPEYHVFSDPRTWLETADERCVILRSTNLPEAQPIRDAIAERWPYLEPVAETDGSGQVRILAYYPLVNPGSPSGTVIAAPATPSR